MVDRYVLRRFQYSVAHFFGSLNTRVGWSRDSDENALIRFPVFADDSQSVAAVPLTRQYSTLSTCAVEFSPTVADPLGSLGRVATRTAPGGGTKSPRIALASAVARCCGVPAG